MALTRKLLKDLGLTEEQIDSIIDAHTKTVEWLNGQVAALTEQKTAYEAAQTELDTLKSGDYQAKYEAVKRDFDSFKAQITAKETAEKKAAAYRERLEACGIDPKRFDAILKITDLSGVEVGADGKLVDAAAVDQRIAEEWSAFKVSTNVKGENVPTPPAGGNKTMTRADIFKKDDHGRYVLTTEQRQKALAENPELLR